jgi:hypothetical protein
VHKALATGAVLAAATGTVLAGVLGVVVLRSGQALPGTTVEGVAVGGLDEDGIAGALADLERGRESGEITLVAAEAQQVVLREDLGVDLDVEATAERAVAAGRGGPLGWVLGPLLGEQERAVEPSSGSTARLSTTGWRPWRRPWTAAPSPAASSCRARRSPPGLPSPVGPWTARRPAPRCAPRSRTRWRRRWSCRSTRSSRRRRRLTSTRWWRRRDGRSRRRTRCPWGRRRSPSPRSSSRRCSARRTTTRGCVSRSTRAGCARWSPRRPRRSTARRAARPSR